MLFYLHEREQSSDESATKRINSARATSSRRSNNQKRTATISTYKQSLLEPSLNVSVMDKTDYRPRNFLVRVFRNGGDGKCAYCASCTMDLILTEATRKLQLIRRAERLFDFRGKEIFRSEQIQRDMDYYVTEGEDFICPSEIIKPKLKYSLYSKWTLDGVVSSYTIKPPRRIRRRQQRKCSCSPELPRSEDKKTAIQYDDKITQTVVLCESKDIQTIGQIPSITKMTQTIRDLDSKSIQTDTTTPTVRHRDTQTIRRLENKDMQTDEMKLRETKDAQIETVTITKEFENKDIQTEADAKPSVQNKITQTITKYEQIGVQTDIPVEDPMVPKDADKVPESARASPVEPTAINPDATDETPENLVTEPPIKLDITPAIEDPPVQLTSVTRSTQTEPLTPRSYRSAKRRSVVDSIQLPRNVPVPTRPRSAPVSSLHEVIYLRPLSVTNFRVRVYRNGERYRYAYCKSCTMDIILSAATQKLQMAIPARRLFDENGVEIFYSTDIQRDLEYYVSSGENFKKPIKN